MAQQQPKRPVDEAGDPIHHTRKMGAMLVDIRDHLRADIERVEIGRAHV